MGDEQETRRCSWCCEPMDRRARFCPHCGLIQWRRALLGMTLPMVLLLLFGVCVIAWGQHFQHRMQEATGPRLPLYAGQIKVTESRMEFGRSPEGPVVLVVGMMKNESDTAWQNIGLDVAFRNPDGKLIDVDARDSYLSTIQPRGELAFKLRGPADLPQEAYARYEVSVRSAEAAPR